MFSRSISFFFFFDLLPLVIIDKLFISIYDPTSFQLRFDFLFRSYIIIKSIICSRPEFLDFFGLNSSSANVTPSSPSNVTQPTANGKATNNTAKANTDESEDSTASVITKRKTFSFFNY